ncbi:N-acetylmuramoyl-L-alanine amidase family protein [Flavivirga jejuensis]|uniref:N-acetylmuramoyl-L-alanine amidase n=1 Tax=Flavivirga jejuensis TaxID=870487 RepID=A0ABT8WRY3_9FLAO|nr:N-acetylmuramoyl-L-alanine amidase [Flavivirga jejuensis]MDO5975962.1 N-acetylmuramoyl-L-alanine amidase [Flavivirga jejuensis]
MKTHKVLLFVSFIIVLTFSSFIKSDEDLNDNKFIVVLDAGHGGRDPGNLGNGFKEKNIALSIVLKIGAILEKMPDFKVIYTRKKDVAVDLYKRPEIANKADADLFVSVHCDSHTSQAYGAGTFVMAVKKIPQNLSVAKKENEVIFLEDDYEKKYGGFNPNSPESLLGLSLIQEEYLDRSILIASLIQKKIITNLKRKDRKVKQDVFWVLHNTYMPSVLVETGFLTNKKEGTYLNSKKGQTEMARQIANGIIEYKKVIDQNVNDEIFVKDDDVVLTDTPVDTTSTNTLNDVIFKVQIAASSQALETKPYNFNGLQSISRLKEGAFYKYYYGATPNYDKVKQLEEEASKKGYTSGFIVAFKGGKKIALIDALKTTAN